MAGRGLTEGEVALAQPAFRSEIAYETVRIVEGPGNSFAAHIAFMRGNPAITLGDTMYFKQGYSSDFSQPGANPNTFMHEMTHIWQYATLGQGPFFVRYGVDLAAAGFDPDKMYQYAAGEDLFTEAKLEAQASMVEHYSHALRSGNATRTAQLAKNLAGSGIYGL